MNSIHNNPVHILRGGRLLEIDFARAMAIVLVVAGHWHPEDSPGWWNDIVGVIYTFHMPLFLAMSGYIYMITAGLRSYREFLGRKFLRLMVPYFTTSIIVLLIKLAMQGNLQVDHPVTWYSFVEMFYLPSAGFYLWFIWALWWMFVIVPLLRTPRVRLIFFVICFFASLVPWEAPQIFCLEQTRRMMVFFMVGVLMHDWSSLLPNPGPWLTALSLAMLVAMEVVCFTVIPAMSYGIPYVAIYTILALCRLWERKASRLTRTVMLSLASASYIIYLFHTTFEGLVKAVAARIPFFQSCFPILTIEVVLAGLILPWTLYYILSLTAPSRWLFGLPKKSL